MRLHAATVRNYRIHREVAITFDPARTLIAGANETGKSTLVEAIHHGLFLRARVTGEAREAMASLVASGVPEVEITFDVGGARYSVAKRFHGTAGTVRLQLHGGQAWQGDEAESKLAGLLGVAELGGGRGIADRVRGQWSHLWVWQGGSGEDPSADLREQNQALIQRLQKTGGAVVHQSPLDQRLVERFAAEVSATFTQAGKPRQHSDLERAMTAYEAKLELREKRRERLVVLQAAVDTLVHAQAELVNTRDDLARLNGELAEVAQRKQQAELLQQQVQALGQQSLAASQALAVLQQAESEIAAYRAEVVEIGARIAPQTLALERQREALASLRDAHEAAAKTVQQAGDELRTARQRLALAEALKLLREKQRLLGDLELQAEAVAKHRADHDAIQQALQRLPAVSQADLDRLAELAHHALQAEASLQAMAAGIEVLAADTPILLDGAPLAAGESRVVSEACELTLGAHVRLRIRPGGGDALALAREVLAGARGAHFDKLAALAVRSREEATGIVAERATHEAKAAELMAVLRGMKADKLPKQLEEARAAANAADAEVQRRGEALAEGESLPETLADAAAWAKALALQLDDAEQQERLQREIADGRLEERDVLAEKVEEAQQALVAEGERMARLETLLGDRLRHYGEDAPRTEALAQAQARNDAEAQALTALQVTLAELQPDMLASDLARLTRSIELTRQQQQSAEMRKGLAEAQLQSDGTQDPAADAAEAEAELERAAAHLAATKLRAEAVRRLSALFAEEQQKLVEQYTQPLAEKITEYLRCLFGPGARAQVTWDAEKNQLAGIRLVRGAAGAAIDFGALSGGTREQLATAVRLAVAEVLAEEQGEGLPVVLDDAFAYSDPVRVGRLQRMLDLAAERGLQVIVLSCTPAEYASLGAYTVQLGVQGAMGDGLGAEQQHSAGGQEDAQTRVVPIAAPPPRGVEVAGRSGPSGDDAGCFVTTLAALGGRSGNHSLMAQLGWDEERYGVIKEQLIAAGRVRPGRGRGGSVVLPGEEPE